MYNLWLKLIICFCINVYRCLLDMELYLELWNVLVIF